MDPIELDALDQIAARLFDGYIVRKDLARHFRGRYAVPEYVAEFLLGRYCSSTDPAEIAEGIEIVEQQLAERTVRPGEEELFKSRARERGTVKVIDLATAKLDARRDAYLLSLPSMRLTDIRIDPDMVRQNERLLTGGFYAEVQLSYDAASAREKGALPFGVASMRPIQLSTRGTLATLAETRRRISTEDWRLLLLRSVGFEPDRFSRRAQDILLLRMVPFVERNYNAVELGPRGTGKSHLYQQVSPSAHLISGGKATVAQMFVNNATGQRGLVAQYDVICFDEIGGVSFDSADGVQIMKGYMESGTFSRGREAIRADGSLVFVGNFEVDMQHQLRVGHLFGPLPQEMRNDTAWMDRVHAYLPGWDVPKLQRSLFTDHFGLVSDFLAECWNQLRAESRLSGIQGRVHLGDALSGRDVSGVNRTLDGLLKLLYPDAEMVIPDQDVEWAVRIALECRRRVKEQQKRIGSTEFGNTAFSYTLGEAGAEQFVATPELERADTPAPEPITRSTAQPEPLDPVSPPAPLKERFAPGDVIHNEYEVLGFLGSGGFSNVYRVRAFDRQEYALKIFLSDDPDDTVQKEIGVLRAISHPNVVKAVWGGRLEDDRWYLVTELVDGETLAPYAYGEKHMPLDESVRVGLELLGALEAIHPDEERVGHLQRLSRDGQASEADYAEWQALKARNIVHRDIKPQNLMLTPEGRIVLLDFGIASHVGSQVMTNRGTPPYQPPDIAIGIQDWDVSPDLFAAGVVLYELICNAHPYEKGEPRIDRRPRDPREYCPDLSPQLSDFLVKACAPYREERFASAAEMRQALEVAARPSGPLPS